MKRSCLLGTRNDLLGLGARSLHIISAPREIAPTDAARQVHARKSAPKKQMQFPPPSALHATHGPNRRGPAIPMRISA